MNFSGGSAHKLSIFGLHRVNELVKSGSLRDLKVDLLTQGNFVPLFLCSLNVNGLVESVLYSFLDGHLDGFNSVLDDSLLRLLFDNLLDNVRLRNVSSLLDWTSMLNDLVVRFRYSLLNIMNDLLLNRSLWLVSDFLVSFFGHVSFLDWRLLNDLVRHVLLDRS